MFLFDEAPWEGGAFQLKPDIVIRRERKVLAVADTKWKLLCDEPKKKFEMTQADMYQMYAYQKRYGAPRALLIYPAHDNLGSLVDAPPAFLTPGDAEVRAMFWNLEETAEAESSAGRVFKAASPLEAAPGKS